LGGAEVPSVHTALLVIVVMIVVIGVIVVIIVAAPAYFHLWVE